MIPVEHYIVYSKSTFGTKVDQAQGGMIELTEDMYVATVLLFGVLYLEKN